VKLDNCPRLTIDVPLTVFRGYWISCLCPVVIRAVSVVGSVLRVAVAPTSQCVCLSVK